MKILLCFLIVLHVSAGFRFNIGRFARRKMSLGMDKLISKMSCESVLNKMDSLLFRPIAHACDCVMEDMKAKQAQEEKEIAELMGKISRLDEELQTLRDECTTTEDALEGANGVLQEICPDSSDLKAACEANAKFTFVQSEDNCVSICYHVNTDLVHYANAEAVCADAGGSLITLATMNKNALMTSTIRKKFPNNSFWMGLTKDDQWKWQGNDPVTFTDWANGEPDVSQHCASLHSAAQHRWFDWRCNQADKNGALCELTVDEEFEEEF